MISETEVPLRLRSDLHPIQKAFLVLLDAIEEGGRAVPEAALGISLARAMVWSGWTAQIREVASGVVAQWESTAREELYRLYLPPILVEAMLARANDNGEPLPAADGIQELAASYLLGLPRLKAEQYEKRNKKHNRKYTMVRWGISLEQPSYPLLARMIMQPDGGIRQDIGRTVNQAITGLQRDLQAGRYQQGMRGAMARRARHEKQIETAFTDLILVDWARVAAGHLTHALKSERWCRVSLFRPMSPKLARALRVQRKEEGPPAYFEMRETPNHVQCPDLVDEIPPDRQHYFFPVTKAAWEKANQVLVEVGPRTLPMTRHAEAYYLDAEPPKLTGLPDPDPMRALYGARGVR